jgi:putative endonuclease
MLASRRYGTLYVGVTNSLSRRIWQHREDQYSGFTKRYDVKRLVWLQGFGEVTQAIGFEKRLKRWRREWKVQLIETENPLWQDLYELQIAPPSRPDLAPMGPG